MKKVLSFLFLFVLGLYSVSQAIEAPSPITDALGGLLENIVFPVFGALVLGLVALLIRKLSEKLKTDILLNNQELIEKIAWQAVTWVEEFTAKQVKQKNIKLTSNQKLDMAVAHIISAVPSISKEQAARQVESILARTIGAGATGEKVLK